MATETAIPIHKWRHGAAGPVTVCTGEGIASEARNSAEHSYAWPAVTCPACVERCPKYALLRRMGA
ncbi:MAG: hypothetical protein HY323_09055 [Betaproteobacteria bacterium]|nr:hypothetical protein [Betaproteobacteria bacterium]